MNINYLSYILLFCRSLGQKGRGNQNLCNDFTVSDSCKAQSGKKCHSTENHVSTNWYGQPNFWCCLAWTTLFSKFCKPCIVGKLNGNWSMSSFINSSE